MRGRDQSEASMQTAIATVCLSGVLHEKLEAIAAAGFKGVEIFENDLLSFNGTPPDVRRMIESLGLKSITFQPFRDFEGMPGERRNRAFQRAERKFDLMQELDCDLLMICSNVSPESLGGIDRAAADLRELGERAAKRGLRVGFEALAWGRHINDYRDAWEAVRRADHPAVGVVLDTFHILARQTDLGALRAIPGDRIFLVQLADAPLLQMDYLSWSRHFRNFPGQGDLPVLDFMAALTATGYDGALSLEIFNDQFRAGSARSVAVDGHRSLRFLVDQLAARTGEQANDAGLTTVDHISQSMQYEEMLTWLLFYSSLLDVRKIPPQEVADPGGLVRSQVVEAADGALRIVLNASQSPRTQSSRFLSELFGSGVQHIAFATDDLQKTVAQLGRNGVRLLSIPENYYEDLSAKTDLPAEQIAALQEHNILYERDGNAEYLQVYTETFDQRFFFEIVERRGYRGYGAANAPVRLAAQAQQASGLDALAAELG